MRRYANSVSLGDGTTRWTILLEDDPSEEYQSEARLGKFLDEISGRLDVLRCGTTIPKRFTVQRNGANWALSAEVILEDI